VATTFPNHAFACRTLTVRMRSYEENALCLRLQPAGLGADVMGSGASRKEARRPGCLSMAELVVAQFEI